jgi:hypothetical protein
VVCLNAQLNLRRIIGSNDVSADEMGFFGGFEGGK